MDFIWGDYFLRVELVMKILNHGATDDRQIIKSICSSFCLCLLIFLYSHSPGLFLQFSLLLLRLIIVMKNSKNECTQWNWLSIKEEILHLNFKYVHRLLLLLLLLLSVNSIYWYWLMFPVMVHKSKSNMLLRCEWCSLIWYELNSAVVHRIKGDFLILKMCKFMDENIIQGVVCDAPD